MLPNLENPFRNPAKRATKRLFGNSQNELKLQRSKEKVEQKLFKYGPHELFLSQLRFIKQVEQLIPKELLKIKGKTAKEVLVERIKDVKAGKIIDLDLALLELKSLPQLPTSLRKLECPNNRLEALPQLPNSLRELSCFDNQLTSLPQLPDSLQKLHCANNKLGNLPQLPNSLLELSCFRNKLVNLPELSDSLQSLACSENELIKLPKLPNSLLKLSCFNNKLTTLPVLPASLIMLKGNLNFFTKETKEKILGHKNGSNFQI